jgi:putative addiction module component (TIGR02574 family)
MSYDIAEIKKLPVEERLEIIEEIWETCVAESPDAVYEDDEKLKSVLEERVSDYESGKMKVIPWDEFIAGLKARRK